MQDSSLAAIEKSLQPAAKQQGYDDDASETLEYLLGSELVQVRKNLIVPPPEQKDVRPDLPRVDLIAFKGERTADVEALRKPYLEPIPLNWGWYDGTTIHTPIEMKADMEHKRVSILRAQIPKTPRAAKLLLDRATKLGQKLNWPLVYT